MALDPANIEDQQSSVPNSPTLRLSTRMPIARNESSQDSPDAIIAKLFEESLTSNMGHSPQFHATADIHARSGDPYDEYVLRMRSDEVPSLARALRDNDTTKIPRRASVHFEDGPRPRDAELYTPQRSNLRRAMAHAMSVHREYDAFQEKRAMIMKKREYVIYQETVLIEKQRWLLEAVKTAEATIISQSSGAAHGAQLQSGLDTILSEMSKVELQTKIVLQLKDDLNKRETDVQRYEDRFHEAIEQFLDSVGPAEIDVVRAGSSGSSMSDDDDDDGKEPTPSDVDDYLDKLGDQRILLERKYELEAEYAEEVAQRALLEDQEKPMPSHVARQTDTDYNREHDELIHDLDAAVAAVQKAYAVCRQRGHDPRKWQIVSSTDDDNDDIDGGDDASAIDNAVVKGQTDADLSSIGPATRSKSKSPNVLHYVQPSILEPFTLKSSIAETSIHPQDVQSWLSGIPQTPQHESAQNLAEQTRGNMARVEDTVAKANSLPINHYNIEPAQAIIESPQQYALYALDPSYSIAAIETPLMKAIRDNEFGKRIDRISAPFGVGAPRYDNQLTTAEHTPSLSVASATVSSIDMTDHASSHVLGADRRSFTTVSEHSQPISADARLENQDPTQNDYKTRGRAFFRTAGRVFSVLWAEPPSAHAQSSSEIALGSTGKSVQQKAQYFIVLKALEKYCICLSISTHSGRGVAGRLDKNMYSIVYSSAIAPGARRDERPKQGEKGMLSSAIRIIPDSKGYALDPMARVNYSKMYTIEYAVHVKPFGIVHEASARHMIAQFKAAHTALVDKERHAMTARSDTMSSTKQTQSALAEEASFPDNRPLHTRPSAKPDVAEKEDAAAFHEVPNERRPAKHEVEDISLTLSAGHDKDAGSEHKHSQEPAESLD